MFPGGARISCRSCGACEEINMVGSDFYKQAGPTDLGISAAQVVIGGWPNHAPAPNRRPRFPLGCVGGIEYSLCAPPAFPAAVGEAQRWGRLRR
jgi:hypothetical protein